jgi:hypothetical protein
LIIALQSCGRQIRYFSISRLKSNEIFAVLEENDDAVRVSWEPIEVETPSRRYGYADLLMVASVTLSCARRNRDHVAALTARSTSRNQPTSLPASTRDHHPSDLDHD